MSQKISRFTGSRFIYSPSPAGFGLRFTVEDDKSVSATVIFDESKEGGPHILHGGAIAAVLDEAMGTAAYEADAPGFTVTMTYHYKTHIHLNTPIQIKAWVDHIEGRKVYTICEAYLPDGKLAVHGTGIFVTSEHLKTLLDQHPYVQDEQ